MSRQHIIQTKKAFAQRAGRHIAPPKTKTEARARSSLHPIEEMQALYGNRAVNQLLASQPSLQAKPMFSGLSGELQNSPMQGKGGQQPTVLQAKLEIGAVGDKYEQEADRVAKDVVSRMNAPQSSLVQREEISEQEEEELQKKPIVQRGSDVGGMAVSPDLEASIQGARGNGHPLSESVRAPIERELGADFSGVRVHNDAKSDEMNRAIQAMAFTTGREMFFRQGAYQPWSRGGQELIVHELTHVMQQKGVPETNKNKGRGRKEERIVGTKLQRVVDIQGLSTQTGEKNVYEKAFKLIQDLDIIPLNPNQRGWYIRGGAQELQLLKRFEKAEKTKLTFVVKQFSDGAVDGETEFKVQHPCVDQLSGGWKGGDELLKSLIASEEPVTEFNVEIALSNKFGQLSPQPTLVEIGKRVGYVMQVIAHELTVHAEPYLEWIEKYNENFPMRKEKIPLELAPVELEHNMFAKRRIWRYEMWRRVVDAASEQFENEKRGWRDAEEKDVSYRGFADWYDYVYNSKRIEWQTYMSDIVTPSRRRWRKLSSLLPLAMGLHPLVGAESPVSIFSEPFARRDIISCIASFL